MWKLGTVLSVGAVAIFILAVTAVPGDAQGGKKIDPKKFKKIITKIDPEIKAAQVQLAAAKKALETARAKLNAAMADEVFGEKGATEGAVIDQLKASVKSTNNALADINAAIKSANKAQVLDKGGD